jgi:hypothetical protein
LPAQYRIDCPDKKDPEMIPAHIMEYKTKNAFMLDTSSSHPMLIEELRLEGLWFEASLGK